MLLYESLNNKHEIYLTSKSFITLYANASWWIMKVKGVNKELYYTSNEVFHKKYDQYISRSMLKVEDVVSYIVGLDIIGEIM